METSKPSTITRYIKSIEHTPQWLIDNLYLKEGYRVGYNCVRSNLMSLFHMHNDLMNIWTHLFGTIFFICVLVYVITNARYIASLDGELKRDIECVSMSDKIRRSYIMNVRPIVANIKEYEGRIGAVRFSKLKDQLSFKIGAAEKDYLEVLQALAEKFRRCELEFLKKFEIQCDRAAQNIGILKTNFVNRVKALCGISLNSFKGAAERLERDLGVEQFFHKLKIALQLDLEVYPIAIFILCAVFCMGASVVYHTFYVISPQVNKLLHKFDMAGINILIFGSVYTVMYYFFYCSPYSRIIYTVCSFVSCCAVFAISMGNRINSADNVRLKGLMFGSLGVSNVVPLIHVVFLSFQSEYNNDNIPLNKVFLGLILMGALYLTGLTFYVFKIPERYYPKTFDIWLNSHTIWHIFVFAATCAHLYSVIALYKVRKGIPCSTWL